MTGMLAVAAEMGYNAAKKRGDSIAQRTVDNGVPNRVPYGYRRNEQDGVKTDPDRHAKALVPDKHTAPTVKRIFKLRGDGESWTGIADALNNAGVPSPSGKRWTVQTLSSTVANDVYLGVVVLGDRRHEGAHTPLVTPAQWRAAQTDRDDHAQRQDDLRARRRRPAVLRVRPADARRQLRHQRQAAVLRVRAPVSRGPVPSADEREQGRRRRLRRPGDGRRDQGRRADPARVRPRARAGPPAGRGRHRAPEGVAQGAGHRRRWTSGDAEYEQRKQAERHAADAYEEQLAHAADVEDLPAGADAWHALDIAHQRLVARSLIDAVIVTPPASRSRYADITKRFAVRFKDGG